MSYLKRADGGANGSHLPLGSDRIALAIAVIRGFARREAKRLASGSI